METGKLFEKTRTWSKMLFLIPFAILLFVFAIFLSPFMTKNYVEGKGIITEVIETFEQDAEGTNQTRYETAFTYTVDGTEYKATYTLGEKNTVGSTITFYYDPQNPNKTSNTMNNGWLWLIFIGAGIAVTGFAIYSAVKDRKRHRQTEALRTQRAEIEKKTAETSPNGDTMIDKSSLAEYYFRFDGHSFKPGYLIEDAFRTPVFEGKMLKNNPFVPKQYEFINHRTGQSIVHKVGHTQESSYGDSEFSTSSGFKFDGVNIWDYLHGKGILISNNLGGKLNMVYEITLNGQFLARAEMTGNYVHEEDAQKKKINITNRMFYRIWTNSDDLELIFTTVFAIAETNQIVYS